MSQTTEVTPFRTKLRVATTNFLQKYRGLLIAFVGAALLIVVGLAVWTQVDAAGKAEYAAQIDQSEKDFAAWKAEADAAKKTELGSALERELAAIQASAPVGYGLSKAWFLQGSYFVEQKKWTEAAAAFHMVFEKDHAGYLAPIALVNAAVAHEEASDTAGALAVYDEFEKNYSADALLAPQVFFTQGRLLETQSKTADAVVAYKKLIDKFPESNWTKWGRDRILLLQD